MDLQGIVYILTNKNNTTLYTGVTRNLARRIAEHKLHLNQGFTQKYHTDKLVYYEVYDRFDDSIHREKQLKKWHRDWKEKLINDFNPEWQDLSESIGCDAEYIQSVKDAYDNAQYAPHSTPSTPLADVFHPNTGRYIPHSPNSPHAPHSPHAGLDPASEGIA